MLAQAYMMLIDRTHSDCYFLWDSLKSALILELKEGREDIIIEICQTPSETTAKRELLIEVLTEDGGSSSHEIASMLDNLANEKYYTDAPKIAIETAFNLGNFSLLEHLAQHNDKIVRHTSAQFTYYLWRKNPEQAWGIIWRLARHARKRLRPNTRILEFCLRVSALILVEGYEDKKSLNQLRRLWIMLLNKILYRDWDELPLVGNLIQVTREKFVGFVAYATWRWIARLGGKDDSEEFPFYTYDGKDLEIFFEGDDEIRARFTKLVNYIDPQGQNLENAWEDLLLTAKSNDLVSSLLILVILTSHGMQYNFNETSPATNPIILFTKKLYDEVMNGEAVYIITPLLLQALAAMGRGYRAESIDQAYLNIMEESVEKYYRKSKCIAQNNRGHEQKVTGFGYYAQLYYIKDPEMKSSFLSSTIQAALKGNQYDFLRRYIKDLARPSHAKRNWAILGALHPVMTLLEVVEDIELQTNLKTDLIDALARVRMHDPQTTEQFFKTIPETDRGLVQEIKNRIESAERKEHLPNLWGRQLGWYVRDTILANPNRNVLYLFLWVLRQLPKSQGFDKWFELLIKTGINLIYMTEGKSIFKEPKIASIYSNFHKS